MEVETRVVAVECHPGRLRLTALADGGEGPSLLAARLREGDVVTGGPQWGCYGEGESEPGEGVPFYRVVVSRRLLARTGDGTPAGAALREEAMAHGGFDDGVELEEWEVETERVGVAAAFKHAHVRVRLSPAPGGAQRIARALADAGGHHAHAHDSATHRASDAALNSSFAEVGAAKGASPRRLVSFRKEVSAIEWK